MFDVGDYVFKAVNGICRVEKIGHPDMGGANPEKLYYFLVPEKGSGGRLYVPVDVSETKLRRVLSEEEAWALIGRMSEIGDMLDPNRKTRDQEMKSIVNGVNPEELVRVIKFLYLDKVKRQQDGKKLPVSEERYFRAAEDQLYGELAFAIGRAVEEMPEIIREAIGQ
ncbi:MAG: CarD family transcriptional regulator [Blautia sp.]|nr:CarD family transcriptional regulator [Blautia sp.]MCM1283542.1 CarD family transcriptional regulator [Roseburia sp.]MCM1431651.1 CarD family transcriptional regulator [Muribaculaceae bacterium]MCM1491677.1 CarD family transcriptional regulator [Muribaculaceae bacterium]